MATKKDPSNLTKRQRRTGNIALSFPSQRKQFIVNCHQRNLTSSTITTYERHLGNFEKYLLTIGHSTLLTEITREVIEEYILVIKEVEKLSPNTVNSSIRHLKAFFAFVVENDVIDQNPMTNIKKLRVDEEPLRPFTDKQIMHLLSRPDKSTFVGYRDYIIMAVLLGTGMRISELLSLRFRDINLQEGSILIRVAKARRARIVGIPKTLKAELTRFFDLCYEDFSEVEFVVQNIDGGQLSIRTIQERIAKYGDEIEISGVRCSPHTFRRTFAINYLKNGGSTASLRQQLGHSSLQTVEKYLYWSDADVLAEHEKYNPFDRMKI